MALSPDFIARNSTYLENLLEHQFLFEVSKELLAHEPPELVNVLQAEVDAFGVDLVLSAKGRTVHLQMKARSGIVRGRYIIPDRLWDVSDAYIVWMIYDREQLNIDSYQLLQIGVENVSTIDEYPPAKKRNKCRIVNISKQDKIKNTSALVNRLFPN